MPAHIVLERARPQAPAEGEPFAVRWALVNAGDSAALVRAWCVYAAPCSDREARADAPPGAPGGASFSEGSLRLQPGERFVRTDSSRAIGWRKAADGAEALYFVASVEYTDDSRALRRTHYVQALREDDGFAQHCHFASLRT